MLRKAGPAVAALMALPLASSLPARADLKLCNNTQSRAGVAVGYKNQDGWSSEGWWTLAPTKCVALLKGDLTARYYYVFVVDYDKGGSWGGDSVLCIKDKVFTIRGIQDCEGRGFAKAKFREIDTGEEKDWTVSLSGEKTTQGK